MKKIIYFSSLFAALFLFSFSNEKINVSVKKSGTCATPTSLSAVKNGGTITLSWTSDPNTHNYGGYYNYINGSGQPVAQSFSGTTNTWPVGISVPSSTYKITYTATDVCPDGSYSTSGPASFNF